LKEVVLAFAWLVAIPLYYFVSFSTLHHAESVRLVKFTVVGYILIVLMNLVGYAAGIQTDSSLYGSLGGDSKFLKLIGVKADRVAFPFGGGVNGYGTIVCLAMIVSAYYLRVAKPVFKIVPLAIFGACVISLLAADSRAALGIGSLAILFWWLFPKLLRFKIVATIALVPVVAPPMLIFIAQIVPAELVKFVSRAGTSGSLDEMLTTGRAVFWKAVYEDLTAHPLNLLYGYGPFSQVSSDAGNELGRYLHSVTGNAQFTFHSNAAQLLMDLGIGGLVAFYLLAFAAVAALSATLRSSRTGDKTRSTKVSELVMILLGALLVAGVTEAAGSPYLRDSQIAFMALCSIATMIYWFWRDSTPRQAVSKDRLA